MLGGGWIWGQTQGQGAGSSSGTHPDPAGRGHSTVLGITGNPRSCRAG